jgi:hypothetical protein
MSTIVKWSDISSQESTFLAKPENPAIMKLETGKLYRIRPVSGPYSYTCLFREVSGQTLSAKSGGQPQISLPDDVKAKSRFAVHVIDRSDNVVKILEGPVTMFRPFGNHASATGRNPDDINQGSDFAVKKTGSGLATRYDVTTIGTTPLSDKEQAAVGKIDMEQTFKKLYQSHTPEQIRERLKLDDIIELGTD